MTVTDISIQTIILITVRNRGTLFAPLWEVYAHESEIVNHHIETFPTYRAAQEFGCILAMSVDVPFASVSELKQSHLLKALTRKGAPSG